MHDVPRWSPSRKWSRRIRRTCTKGFAKMAGSHSPRPQIISRICLSGTTDKLGLWRSNCFTLHDPHPDNSSDWHLYTIWHSSGCSIMTYFLTFYLVYILIYSRTLSGILSDMGSGISCNIPCATVPIYSWNLIWHVILTRFFRVFYLTFFFWQSIWRALCHSIWYSIWHCAWHRIGNLSGI